MSSDKHSDLLTAYQRELSYLRLMGAEYAARYPKIAARLDLSEDACADPHVERLIECFAFLTARLQHQLDSELPEFTSALMGALYPHLQDPLPSLSIARLEVDPDQGLPLGGFPVRRGAPLFTQSNTGAVVRFRTCYPVTLWPVAVTDAQFEDPDRYPFLDAMPKVSKVLRVRLTAPTAGFNELTLQSLRFFLNGEPKVACGLYDLLSAQVQNVALLADKRKEPMVLLPADVVQPVGFGDDEALLPIPAHAHPAYRHLQEYFAFPEKFLFFDVKLGDIRKAKRTLDILFLLDEGPRQRLNISANTFALGCTPIINLFERTTEPIRLDERQPEYALIADKLNERSVGVHSLLSVSASEDPENVDTLQPIFSFNHPADGEHASFYHAVRRPTGRADVPGTDLHLTFVDLHMRPQLPAVKTVYAHTLCTNRDLAEQMSAGAELQPEEGGPLKSVVCLRKPTAQIELPAGGPGMWRLISQLSLNYLSLTGGERSLSALREMLRLYRFNPRVNDDQVMGIRRMLCRPTVLHLGEEAWRGFRQGLEITLEFDESLYVGSSALLLSAVLSRFFGLYAAVNSFTQLVVRSTTRQKEWKRWEPMAGELAIL